MQPELATDIATIEKIDAVPTILEAISELTGLRLVCIARVTLDSWHSCAVLDRLNFGLKVGDSIDVTTTLCAEVRDTNTAIIIDSVRDCETYRDHPAPKKYGFESCFSIPLYRPSGEFFGTLCGIDSDAANLTGSTTRKALMLFAELISRQLASISIRELTEAALADAMETAKLREQFIAVLSHDLRTPLSTLLNGTEMLRQHVEPSAIPLLETMRRSGERIAALIDDVSDFTRGRMGGGISLNLRHEKGLEASLNQAIDELRNIHPDREIVSDVPAGVTLLCDAPRMGQLLSNLLKNALVHGSAFDAVHVSAKQRDGFFELSVTNAGPAISDDIQAQLFKPFWQAHKTGGGQGLGLGLFIASEIARSHGGTLEVESTDTATTFTYRVRGASFVERRSTPRFIL